MTASKSSTLIQVANPSQRACFSLTSQEDRCDKCSRSPHRTASGKHEKETKSGLWWTRYTMSPSLSRMLESTSQASTSAGPWPILMGIAFPTVCASTCTPRMESQILRSWASVAGQATASMSKSPWNARVTSNLWMVNWRPAASCYLRCRRRPTLNSVWIVSGKSLEEVNKQLCTFS